MPACPLTSQPSHHQSPPSHRVYRKPSVHLVTSRHVARRCCALWCCDVHTAHNGATTENNSFRAPSPLPEYRQCPRLPPSEKKEKRAKNIAFFPLLSPFPRPPSCTAKNRLEPKTKKTLSIAPLRDSPLRSPLLLLLLLLLFHQPPPPPPTTNRPINRVL